MANLFEYDYDTKTLWNDWVASRPAVIQDLCKKLPPNKLYQMAENGSKVTLHSYHEDGTVTVNISGEYNQVLFDRSVFGVNPDDLSECDLPSKSEKCGTRLTDPGEIDACIASTRKNHPFNT